MVGNINCSRKENRRVRGAAQLSPSRRRDNSSKYKKKFISRQDIESYFCSVSRFIRNSAVEKLVVTPSHELLYEGHLVGLQLLGRQEPAHFGQVRYELLVERDLPDRRVEAVDEVPPALHIFTINLQDD